MTESADIEPRRLAIAGGSLGALFLLLTLAVWFNPHPTTIDTAVRDVIERANPNDRFEWGTTQTSRIVDAIAVAFWDGLLVLLVWRTAGLRTATVFGIALAAFYAVVVTLKFVIHRPRPDDAFSTTGAFPSGHAAHFGLAFYLLTIVVLPLMRSQAGRPVRRKQWVAVAAATSIAFGLYRVFVGEHWITDVIGSLLLAPAWAIGTQYVLQIRTRSPVAANQIPNG